MHRQPIRPVSSTQYLLNCEIHFQVYITYTCTMTNDKTSMAINQLINRNIYMHNLCSFLYRNATLMYEIQMNVSICTCVTHCHTFYDNETERVPVRFNLFFLFDTETHYHSLYTAWPETHRLTSGYPQIVLRIVVLEYFRCKNVTQDFSYENVRFKS